MNHWSTCWLIDLYKLEFRRNGSLTCGSKYAQKKLNISTCHVPAHFALDSVKLRSFASGSAVFLSEVMNNFQRLARGNWKYGKIGGIWRRLLPLMTSHRFLLTSRTSTPWNFTAVIHWEKVLETHNYDFYNHKCLYSLALRKMLPGRCQV